MSEDRDALKSAFTHALEYLAALDEAPAAPRAGLDTLRAALHRPLPGAGMQATAVIDELVADTQGGLSGSQGGRFFGWVIGGGVPAAMAADWLTTVWDQNAGIYACSPAAAIVEEIAGAWLCELFELPPSTSFAFTTGTQMAHATCLAAARHAVLAARGWDVSQKGLFGAPRIRVLGSAERHASVDRALRLLGFGTDAIEPLRVDAEGRVARQALADALTHADGPCIVVLQAGELNLAAFDRFAELALLSRTRAAWVHVDGAFGLWARTCPETRHLVDGIETCDSWTTDAHKYLNVPYDSGLAFVRDAAAHRAAMTLSTSYLPAGGAARDEIDYNPEFSRRARGFAVYAALRQLGRDGVAELVRRTIRHANAMAETIGRLPGAEVIGLSSLNQALVRFRAPGRDAGEAEHARRTEAVIAAVNASGEALFGGVTWRGKRAMRISVCNWRTSDNDVARAVAAVDAALRIC